MIKVGIVIKQFFKDVYVFLFRVLGNIFVLSPQINKLGMYAGTSRKILIIGVVLGDRPNHYNHISTILNNSDIHDVKQVWVVLKAKQKLKIVDGIEHIYIDQFTPRSQLINSVLRQHSKQSYDYIMITDDDIRLPKKFIDQFVLRQEQYDFSLAQPARTPESIISHYITKQNKDLTARRTNFVEIGPFVSIRKDIQELLLPFDTETPMGWGLDYVWPYQALKNNKKLGIIDCVPVTHTLRKTAASYNKDKALKEMDKFLQNRPHLKEKESKIVLTKYSN